VNTIHQIPVFVNGRGDMGRTPVLTQTDMVVAHEVKFGEGKKMRFEFNALDLFNQKTSRNIFNSLNRSAGLARASAAIDLHNVDLFKGYDFNAFILASPEGRNAYDPRCGEDDLFNPASPAGSWSSSSSSYFLAQNSLWQEHPKLAVRCRASRRATQGPETQKPPWHTQVCRVRWNEKAWREWEPVRSSEPARGRGRC
jgi:hypothetical protein